MGLLERTGSSDGMGSRIREETGDALTPIGPIITGTTPRTDCTSSVQSIHNLTKGGKNGERRAGFETPVGFGAPSALPLAGGRTGRVHERVPDCFLPLNRIFMPGGAPQVQEVPRVVSGQPVHHGGVQRPRPLNQQQPGTMTMHGLRESKGCGPCDQSGESDFGRQQTEWGGTCA